MEKFLWWEHGSSHNMGECCGNMHTGLVLIKKNKTSCVFESAGFRICIFSHSGFLFDFAVCVLYCLLLTGFALCLVLVPRSFDCPNFLPPVSRSPVYLNPAHGKRVCEPKQTFSSLGPGVQSKSEQLQALPAQASQIMACLDLMTPVQTASATLVSPPRTYRCPNSLVGTHSTTHWEVWWLSWSVLFPFDFVFTHTWTSIVVFFTLSDHPDFHFRCINLNGSSTERSGPTAGLGNRVDPEWRANITTLILTNQWSDEGFSVGHYVIKQHWHDSAPVLLLVVALMSFSFIIHFHIIHNSCLVEFSICTAESWGCFIVAAYILMASSTLHHVAQIIRYEE